MKRRQSEEIPLSSHEVGWTRDRRAQGAVPIVKIPRIAAGKHRKEYFGIICVKAYAAVIHGVARPTDVAPIGMSSNNRNRAAVGRHWIGPGKRALSIQQHRYRTRGSCVD